MDPEQRSAIGRRSDVARTVTHQTCQQDVDKGVTEHQHLTTNRIRAAPNIVRAYAALVW